MSLVRPKRLILNADEFGAVRCLTDAIWECLQSGVLTSTTILAGGLDFDYAAGLAKENTFCGMHLCLVDFPPVAAAARVPTLVRPDVNRLWTLPDFLKRYVSGRINPAEIELELEQQITKCLDHGIALTHFDGHCNLHMLPGVFHSVRTLMVKYRIRRLRYPTESLFNIDWRQPLQYVKKLAIAGCARLNRVSVQNGFLTTDHFIGNAQSCRIDQDALLRLLNSLQPGSTEIPLHPANYDEAAINAAFDAGPNFAHDYFRYAPRTKETLLSAAVRDHIRKLDIQLISYGDL